MFIHVKKNLFDHAGKGDLSFLILDFNRPAESLTCLESIRRHVKFDHKVIFYSNGGIQDYVWDFYKRGLVDLLMISNKNEGSSIGTIRLTEICPTDYFINFQCDNYIVRDFEYNELKQMQELLWSGIYGAIDFAYVGQDKFSERAFMAKTEFYGQNFYQTGYGTGPFQDPTQDNSEQAFTKHLKFHDKKVFHWPHRLIADNGRYAIIEVNGGVMKRRCDTHQVWVLKTPTKSMPMWNLSDSDWSKILNNQWENGSIPPNSVKDAFFFYSNELDPP